MTLSAAQLVQAGLGVAAGLLLAVAGVAALELRDWWRTRRRRRGGR